MLSSRKLHLLLALLLFAGNGFAGDKNDEAKPPKDADAKNAPATETSEGHGAKDEKDGKAGADPKEKGKISLPLIEKQPSKGLKIPYYDAQGKLQMIFTIGVAERKDADHVEMSGMTIETFDEHGDSEMGIDLPKSELDLNSRVLTSHTSATIKRDDFQISGDSLEFNTETKKSKLVGHVHMFIYDLNEAASSPAATPKPKPMAMMGPIVSAPPVSPSTAASKPQPQPKKKNE